LAGILAGVVGATSPVLAHPGLHEQAESAERDLAASPGDPEAHLRLARLHGESGSWDEAFAAFTRARRLGADSARVALLEGATWLDAGRPAEALERFGAVLDRDAGRVDARLGRARALARLGRQDAAVRDYGRVLARLPELRPAHVLELRDLLVKSGRRFEALAALDRGIERLGPVPVLQLAAIDLAAELGRWDNALARLDALLATSPDHPHWLARRANLLAAAGRDAEARVARARAIERIDARARRRPSRRLQALASELRANLASTTARDDHEEERP